MSLDLPSKIVQQLQMDTVLLICLFDSDWVEARLLNNCPGFVRRANGALKRENKFLFRALNTVHDSKVALYSQPENTSPVIRSIAQEERVIVDRLTNRDGRKWLQVELPTGEGGYIDGETHFSKTEKVTVSEETWTCRKCFKINLDAHNRCVRCGVPMAAQPPPGGAGAVQPVVGHTGRRGYRAFYTLTVLLILFQSSLIGAIGRLLSGGIDAMIHGAARPRLQEGGTASEHLFHSIQEIVRVLPTWLPALIPILLFLYTFLLNPILSHIIMERLLPARMCPPKMNDNFMVPAMFLSFAVFAILVYHSSP